MRKSLLQVETDRLIIRPFQKEDYKSWYEGFHNRLPSQYKYDDGYRDLSSSTKEWFAEWIQGFHEEAKRDEMYVLGVFRKEDGVNVGKVELIKLLRMDYQWAMMGYSIHNQYWKKGYGVKSVGAAIYLFFEQLQFHRIELHINVDNEASIRLAERAGFLFECTRKEFSFENDKWTNFLIYYKNRVEQ
ncbi:GNAT family N-acetyltransferase [Bacillus sp. C1]